MIRKVIFSCLFALLALTMPTSAQQLDMDKFEGMKPRNVGPAGMSGRITAIDVVNSNPDIMYVGSASGGIWKSTSGGIKWEPIFDDYGAASIGAIDIFQKNPSIIWAGTGEGNPRNSQTSGAGVYKSIDGGRSWTLMGLEGTRNIHRVIIHPEDPNTVFVGAQGSAWGDSEDRGVFKTTDGGKTWEKILYVNTRTGIGDMVMDPTNPDKIFAAMWEFRRWPWFFKSGGAGSGLYMTLDGGDTWKRLDDENGLPEGDFGRIGVAIAPSKPDVVYAHVESKKNGIYRSDDGGFTWELRQTVEEDGDVGNRPFYYAEIYVDPFNENRVFSIYTYISKSEDGAKSFESLYPYYNWVHPDHHAFWLSHESPGFMMDGNDGGVNITYDGGDTWRFIDNIPVGQYYHVNVDNDIPYNIYGGMQDNGSWQGPAYVWRDGGIRNAYWEELFFGDGFDVMMDPSNDRYLYAMSQQGNIGRVDKETGTARYVRPTHPDGEQLRFNWNAAVNFDPFDDETIYFGSQYVHKSTDRGESWTIISPDLTTNDPEKQRQWESGGITMDATGAENHTTILAIEPSTLMAGLIWVGSDDGKVHITQDGGANWTDVSKNIKNVPEGSYVAQIKASVYNAGEAVAVINNYRRDDWTPYLMHTTNYGKSWKNIAAKKGIEGYSLSFVQDPVEPNLMFYGTEFGLYVSIDGSKTWTKWTAGYPTVSTYDMVIHPREHDLVIGTFGRAFWVLDNIRPLRRLAQEGRSVMDRAIAVYEPSPAYQAGTRQARGMRFSADGVYAGENRSTGALITYSVNKEVLMTGDEEADKKAEKEKIKVMIYDADGNQVRSREFTPNETGFAKFTWNMDRKGVRGASRNAPRGNNNFEPSGGSVLPGTYKVVMHYGDYSDSTMVEVNSDPRIEIPMDAQKKTYDFRTEWMSVNKRLADAVSQLHEAQKVIKLHEDLAKADTRDKAELKTINDMNKETKKKIDDMMNMIFGKRDERQGITSSPDVTVQQRLRAPARYLGNDFDGPGSHEENLLRLANEAVDEAVSKINDFVSNDWVEYQKAMQAADFSPFKELKTVD